MRNWPGRNLPFSMSVTQLCERKNSSFCLSVAICRLIAWTSRVETRSFSRHALSCLPASAFTLLTSMGGHPTPRVNQCPATLPSQLYRTPRPRGRNLTSGRKCGQLPDSLLLWTRSSLYSREWTSLGIVRQNGYARYSRPEV